MLARALPPGGRGSVALPPPALPLPAELGLAAHKAGIPSLCNDKLGIRFVKANWMRLLTYTALTMQYSKCTDSRVCARATRFIDPDIARVHRASSFPPGIPARDSSYRPFYQEREREREKEEEGWRNDELLDPDRALLAPVENAMPECRCQIEFLPYAASRDKYDRKIFAIFEISLYTLGWDVSQSLAATIRELSPSPLYTLPFFTPVLPRNAIYRTFMISIAHGIAFRAIRDVYLRDRVEFFNFNVARRTSA